MFSLCRFFNQDISRWDVGRLKICILCFKVAMTSINL
nr:DUF285 domain-containing protein [Campylobacter coli]